MNIKIKRPRPPSVCNYEYPRSVTLACAEVVRTVTEISKPSSEINLDDLHKNVCAAFGSIVKQCKLSALPDNAALELIYPLAALVDETVLRIPRYRFDWSARSLQLRYFVEIVAGTKFFAKLERHMKADRPNGEALELYFTGLALGLKGMYGETAEDARRCAVIFEELGIMLKNLRAEERKARRGNYKPAAVGKRESVWRKAVVPSAYFAIAFLTTVAAAVFFAVSRNGLLAFLERF